MKALFAALLGVALLAAPVADVLAQGSPAPAAQEPSSASGSVSTDRSSSSTSTTTKSESRDDGSALPRTVVTERTTIFGLSPTAAVLIAAALLLVVVLAIVAMTRGNDAYIDQRRM